MMISVLVGTMLTGIAFADGKVKATHFVQNGKAMVVSTNGTAEMMIVTGTFTNGQLQVSWPVAFGSAPTGVSMTWMDDMTGGKLLGGSNAMGFSSMTVTSFLPKIALPLDIATNVFYMIVAPAP
ncbi:MAG: hypothetical protein K9N51_02480 [Candidatus Pacebacteria bacterium]|nr:hypothetical protein [Candidatus Paceibacterota bacterium]